MEWISQLQEITRDYQSAFGGLSEAQLNWKPSADEWSVGQGIDHVITTNAAYFPVLAAIKAGTYQPHFNARFGFLATFFGNLVLGAVQPEAKRKVKTGPVFEPRQSAIPADIVARFAAHQAQFQKEIENAGGILDRVVSSPMNRAVVYRVSRAFDILVAHERRHLQQAKAVMARFMP
jgi:hypothetical protein